MNPSTSFAVPFPMNMIESSLVVLVVKLNVVLSAVANSGISVFIVSTTSSIVRFPALKVIL